MVETVQGLPEAGPVAASRPWAGAWAGANGTAQANPSAQAIVGPGGVAISFPTAEAVVGAHGVAVSRPSAASTAGDGGVAVAGGLSIATSGLEPKSYQAEKLVILPIVTNYHLYNQATGPFFPQYPHYPIHYRQKMNSPSSLEKSFSAFPKFKPAQSPFFYSSPAGQESREFSAPSYEKFKEQ